MTDCAPPNEGVTTPPVTLADLHRAWQAGLRAGIEFATAGAWPVPRMAGLSGAPPEPSFDQRLRAVIEATSVPDELGDAWVPVSALITLVEGGAE